MYVTLDSQHKMAYLDFDAKGRLVGIEVMNAKKVLPEALLAEAERI